MNVGESVIDLAHPTFDGAVNAGGHFGGDDVDDICGHRKAAQGGPLPVNFQSPGGGPPYCTSPESPR